MIFVLHWLHLLFVYRVKIELHVRSIQRSSQLTRSNYQTLARTGTIPTQWSIHVISPILKSGDRSSVRNYRPISLLCTVSKVLERIVHEKIIDFLSPAISSHQFGFLRNRSVLQQLLIFLHNILSSFSTKSQVDVIYLDIRKAFDSIPHDKLLLK